ncbi:MAG: putative glycoside hydrolase [bacterium]|nr:putative glycoside hydrolase [bacterium]
MKRFAIFLVFMIGGVGLFFFFTTSNKVPISLTAEMGSTGVVTKNPEPKKPVSLDAPFQKPLKNPPAIIKAVYATGWSAGSEKSMARLIKLIKDTELNAIVIDIKDYSGMLSYDADISLVDTYKGEEIKITKPNALIKRLHDDGIYVIARQTIFQDPVLAKARPDLALMSSSTKKQWGDNKGVMWMDTSAREVWDYNIEIAKDAIARGFDEINFDYIRFASDGKIDDIIYPYWDGVRLKRYVLKDFWKYLRKALPDATLSADLFGLVTLDYGDLGIGQNMDDAFHYFDAIAPMVYPSHYYANFNGYKNPANYPYQVVYDSMLEAEERLAAYKIKAALSTSTEQYLVKEPTLRPWLQDFDLGAMYTKEMVRAQIDATYAAAGLCASIATTTNIGVSLCSLKEGQTGGSWMLWDPRNIYTREALLSE